MEIFKLILEHLLELVFLVLAPVLLYLVRRGMKWLEDKLDFDINANMEATIEGVVRSAIAYAEQQRHKIVKADRGQVNDKLEDAVRWASDEIRHRGLPEVASDRIVGLIEAKLGEGKAETKITGF